MRNKNNLLFYWINFFTAFSLITPIWAFFFTSYLSFSLGWAIFLTVFSWIVTLVFEIPTWALTDRFGRKKTFILWTLLQVFSLSFYIFSESIELFLVSWILLGIGHAFCSGNLESIIHDNLEWGTKEKDFSRIQSWGMTSLFLWRAWWSILWWYAFMLSPLLPIYITLFFYSISFILIFFVSDKNQVLSKEYSNSSHIIYWLKVLIQKKELVYFIWFLGIFSSLGNIYWYTYQPYMESIGLSISTIWIVYSWISIFSALWSYAIDKLLDIYNRKDILLWMYVLLLICSVCFVFTSSFIWIIQILLLAFIFGFVMVLWNSYIIEHAPKTHKSTFLSFFSTTITIWYFVAGTVFWFLSDRVWLVFVYSLVPFLILFTMIFYYLTQFYERNRENSKTS